MQLELFRIKPQTVLDAPQLRKIDQYMSFDVNGVFYVANRLQEVPSRIPEALDTI